MFSIHGKLQKIRENKCVHWFSMSGRASNMGELIGIQSECFRVGADWRSSTPTCTPSSVAFDCSFICDSGVSLGELTFPSTTNCLPLLGSRSSLPATRAESPSAVHPACRCVGSVSVHVTVLRESNGLCARNSPCAAFQGAFASSTVVGTNFVCGKSIAKWVPCTGPISRMSFLRIGRIYSSVGHGCSKSGSTR